MSRRLIALFLQNGANDYQSMLREDAAAAAARQDFSLAVYSADNDGETQRQQVQRVLGAPPSQRPTAVLVSPVREVALLAAAHEAATLGIGWVPLNRWSDYLLELRRGFPTLPVFSVTADQREVGRIQGQQVRCLLHDAGELVYIQGPLGTSSAHKRFIGLTEELAGCPGIKVSTFNSDWSSDGGEQAMRDWIRIFPRGQLPKCAVGAQNDSMAMGARRALLDWAGRRGSIDHIPLTGCDGTPNFGQRLVREGKLTATVIIPSVAARAVDEVALMLTGARPPSPEIVVPVSSCPDLAAIEKAWRASR